MLRRGDWLAEYISISSVLKNKPIAYARSFLYTETDDNDLRYFIVFNLKTISEATEALKAYVRKTSLEIRMIEEALCLLPGQGPDQEVPPAIGHGRSHRDGQDDSDKPTERRGIDLLQGRGGAHPTPFFRTSHFPGIP